MMKDMTAPLDRKLVDAVGVHSTPTLHEVMGQTGTLPSYLRCRFPGTSIQGTAFTVTCRPGDNLMLHYAVARASSGDVLVVDAKGFLESGLWGDVLAGAAKARGIAGLVIDGSVRDVLSMQQMGFSVFSRGISMKGSTKALGGEINAALVLGGVRIVPGDIIVGDDDGIVCVPRGDAARVLELARAREEKEEGFRQKIREGRTTIELLGLEPALRAHGLTL
jgi:4-hydroxy-4-methyl-2-oxoglutarate aldolase